MSEEVWSYELPTTKSPESSELDRLKKGTIPRWMLSGFHFLVTLVYTSRRYSYLVGKI
jgi:hypothetical protein